jgi:hypothetical protein
VVMHANKMAHLWVEKSNLILYMNSRIMTCLGMGIQTIELNLTYLLMCL